MTRLDFADKVADALGLSLRNRLRGYQVAERVLPRFLFKAAAPSPRTWS